MMCARWEVDDGLEVTWMGVAVIIVSIMTSARKMLGSKDYCFGNDNLGLYKQH